jgi:hypothetical protein
VAAPARPAAGVTCALSRWDRGADPQ